MVHGFPKFEDNKVTIDGGTNLAFSEDTAQIFAAKARDATMMGELSEEPAAIYINCYGNPCFWQGASHEVMLNEDWIYGINVRIQIYIMILSKFNMIFTLSFFCVFKCTFRVQPEHDWFTEFSKRSTMSTVFAIDMCWKCWSCIEQFLQPHIYEANWSYRFVATGMGWQRRMNQKQL